VQKRCAAPCGVDDVRRGCAGYEPDPAITEYWRGGKLIIYRPNRYAEGLVDEDED
jgi:hypothetical protein